MSMGEERPRLAKNALGGIAAKALLGLQGKNEPKVPRAPVRSEAPPREPSRIEREPPREREPPPPAPVREGPRSALAPAASPWLPAGRRDDGANLAAKVLSAGLGGQSLLGRAPVRGIARPVSALPSTRAAWPEVQRLPERAPARPVPVDLRRADPPPPRERSRTPPLRIRPPARDSPPRHAEPLPPAPRWAASSVDTSLGRFRPEARRPRSAPRRAEAQAGRKKARKRQESSDEESEEDEPPPKRREEKARKEKVKPKIEKRKPAPAPAPASNLPPSKFAVQDKKKKLLEQQTKQLQMIMGRLQDPNLGEKDKVQLRALLAKVKAQMNPKNKGAATGAAELTVGLGVGQVRDGIEDIRAALAADSDSS